jgi:hypothetical protein
MATSEMVRKLGANYADAKYGKAIVSSELLAEAAHCIEAMEAALREIAESDDIDNALDPTRNKRVARTALTED